MSSKLESPRPRHAGTSERAAATRHSWIMPVIASFLALLGVLVLCYPSAASWVSQLQQLERGERYTETVEAMHPVDRAEALAAAQSYNDTLASGAIVDPFTSLATANVEDDDPYWKLLNGDTDGAMSRIRVPAIDLDLPIFHGTSDAVLRKGVGHLRGTSLPVGGVGTHSVLTGHRGLPEAELFTRLDELKVGESIELETYGEHLYYEITTIETVLPNETESLRAVAGKDLITLVTCTPIGINSHRILVTAERVDAPSEAQRPSDGVLAFPWWAVIVSAAVLAEFAAIAVIVRRSRKARRREESAAGSSS